MTVGSALDRVDLGALPDHVRVESYVPQRFLLERADAVVSHAGSGTLFATAARGLPQVCIPVGADQWENAEAATAAGVALLLGTDERDAASIHRAVVEVLDDPAVRSRAGALAAAFAGLPHPRELVAAVEALA
jgi:UDP:flavonoid glycosyltransferase YjiC (YdhE family)